MKWLVDEMTGIWNDFLKKWMQMAGWLNDKYIKWLSDDITGTCNDW